MDYLQEDSQSSVQNDDQELERYHKLFKNYKQIKDSIQRQNYQKQSSKKSMNSVQKAIQVQQQKNLQTRITFTEKQYAKARQNNILLLKKLSQAQQQNEFLKFEHDKMRRQKDEQIQMLKHELSQLRSEQLYKKQRQQYEQKQKDSTQIIQLKNKLEHKEKEINRLYLKIKSLELDKKNGESQIKNLNNLNEMFKKKVFQLENNMNEIYLGEESRGAQLLELDQAKQAVERLVLLLKNTEQYKKFGNFAEDFKEIHYLKNLTKRLKSNSLSQQIERKKACNCCEIKLDERLLWTPSACYKIMLEMKLKYEEMNQDCIQECLFELNKLWLVREEAHVGRVRQSLENQIAKLKKKSEERYDQMVARKQIQRLKKELQQSKFSKKPSSSGTDNIDLLKNIGQYQDELRLKQRQIKLLQDRIKLMQTQNNNYDKVLYLEGALWIIDKILDEIDQNNEDILEFQTRFRQNIQNFNSTEDWTNAFKEFFEAISELNNSLIEKLAVMKDSTLKKMGNQRDQLRQSSFAQNSKRH